MAGHFSRFNSARTLAGDVLPVPGLPLSKVGSGLEPAGRLFLQATAHDTAERRRNRGRQLGRLFLQDGVHHLDRRFAGKGPLAAEHLIEHHAEAEQVRAMVGGFAPYLLRRHVASRAQHHTFIRQIGSGRIRRRVPLLGQPEIQDLHVAAARDHDVVRLQIAVHQTGRVRRREAGGHLHRNLDCPRRGKRASLDRAPQGVPADQLGSDPVDTVVATDVVNGDDVGVVERAGRARFPLETGDAVRVAGQAGGQHLNRHVPLQACVARAPYLAHPTPAQQVHNLEVTELGARAQRLDPRRRSAFQKRIGLLVQQRLHLAAELRIVRTRLRQECGAFLRRLRQRGLIQLLDLLPALSLHARPSG